MENDSHDAATTPAPADDQRRKQLTDLSAQATGAYGRKDYNKAAELYAEAVELQAELNGEMWPSNAELLYAYGRCLYKVGVSQSDVLGNKVAGDGTASKKRKRESASTSTATKTDAVDSSAVTAVKNGNSRAEEDSVKKEGQPYFELQGDGEDWDDSDEDGEDAEAADGQGADAAEDEDDDFAIAYEILDVARVLYNRQIESQRESGKGKGKDTDMDPTLRQLLEKLADIRDLQAEISLENEKFPEAVEETRTSLAILGQLYPLHNRLVAEAHFKLSLALEFASITTVKAADGQKQEEAQVDEAMRAEAAEHTAKTIESCKLRKSMEEEALLKLSGDEAAEKQRQLKDISEMLDEFEQRVSFSRAACLECDC